MVHLDLGGREGGLGVSTSLYLAVPRRAVLGCAGLLLEWRQYRGPKGTDTMRYERRLRSIHRRTNELGNDGWMGFMFIVVVRTQFAGCGLAVGWLENLGKEHENSGSVSVSVSVTLDLAISVDGLDGLGRPVACCLLVGHAFGGVCFGRGC